MINNGIALRVNSFRIFQTALIANEVAPSAKKCRMIKPVSPNAAPKAVPEDAVSINDDKRVVQNMLIQ